MALLSDGSEFRLLVTVLRFRVLGVQVCGEA